MKRLKKLPAVCATTGVSLVLAIGLTAAGTEAEADKAAQSSSSTTLQQQQDQQEFGARQGTRTPTGAQQGTRGQTEMEIYEVSELEGLQVQSDDGKNLGSVKSLAVDLQGESPSFVVVESGGVLGVGADLKVVPVEAIEISQEEGLLGERQVVKVEIEETKWEQIPSYESAEILRLCDAAQAREVYQHYNINWEDRSSMQFGGRDELNIETEKSGGIQVPDRLRENEASDRDIDDEWDALRERRDEQARVQANLEQQGQNTEPTSDELLEEELTQENTGIRERNEDAVFGASERREVTEQQRSTAESSGSCELVMTSELKGRTIHDAQQTEVGSIDDVVFDVSSGRVEYVLMSPQSEILERSNEVYAVSPRTFRSITSEEAVLEVTSEELQQAEALTQTSIRQQSRQGTGTERQIFRFERDQIEFGRPDRQSQEKEQERSIHPDSTESDSDARSTSEPGTPPQEQREGTVTEPSPRDSEFGSPEVRDPNQRRTPPPAQREGRATEPSPRESEFGSPEARDRSESRTPPHAGEPGQPPHAGQPGQPPHAEGQERGATPPQAEDQERGANPPSARGSEFGSPDARDSSQSEAGQSQNQQQQADQEDGNENARSSDRQRSEGTSQP